MVLQSRLGRCQRLRPGILRIACCLSTCARRQSFDCTQSCLSVGLALRAAAMQTVLFLKGKQQLNSVHFRYTRFGASLGSVTSDLWRLSPFSCDKELLCSRSYQFHVGFHHNLQPSQSSVFWQLGRLRLQWWYIRSLIAPPVCSMVWEWLDSKHLWNTLHLQMMPYSLLSKPSLESIMDRATLYFSVTSFINTAYFPDIWCRNLWFGSLIIIYSLLAFSARALVLQHFTLMHLLADFNTEDAFSFVKSIFHYKIVYWFGCVNFVETIYFPVIRFTPRGGSREAIEGIVPP